MELKNNVKTDWWMKSGPLSVFVSIGLNIGIKDVFECFMMVLNYRSAALKPQSPKG